MNKLGMIGGGAMGSAIIKGLVQSKLFNAADVFLREPDVAKAKQLQSELGIQITDSIPELAKQCSIIILAVKPQVIAGVLTELATVAGSQHLFLSIAAGIQLSTLEDKLPETRCVRVMPNTPAQIGRGVSVFCTGQKVISDDLDVINRVFGCIGKVLQVPEERMDAVTALSGSGPAYVYYFIQALIDAGVFMGLSRHDALVMATETVAGAAEMVQQTGEHPVKLQNDVTSPGGTTAAALYELEKEAVAGKIMQAVLAAARRSAELGKK